MPFAGVQMRAFVSCLLFGILLTANGNDTADDMRGHGLAGGRDRTWRYTVLGGAWRERDRESTRVAVSSFRASRASYIRDKGRGAEGDLEQIDGNRQTPAVAGDSSERERSVREPEKAM